MGRKIAIIGTAGRDKNYPLSAKHWDFMCNTVIAELEPDDHLISGGAAWADHVAVWAVVCGLWSVVCGLAGFKDTDIAPLFKEALPLKNVRLPQGWRHFITTGEVVPFHDEAEDEPVQISYGQALAETKESIGRFKDFLAKPIE